MSNILLDLPEYVETVLQYDSLTPLKPHFLAEELLCNDKGANACVTHSVSQ